MFSRRLPWNLPENRLAEQARGRTDILDLTESNPTRVGLPYPEDRLRRAFAAPDLETYEPAPRGLPVARAAIADEHRRGGELVDPEQVIVTASSSESYGFLFKLCCDPSDAVLVPEPSYPLFEYLARLEAVVAVPYRLAFDGTWHVDFASVEEAVRGARGRGHRPRAVVVVNPNNPTGSYLKVDELARLVETCAREELALVSDEVFARYPHGRDVRPPERAGTVAVASSVGERVPAFSLGGLSKGCGLPGLKVGWIVVGGRDRAGSLSALELIADTYLSAAAPVQRALPELLSIGAGVRAAIAARIAENLATLRRAIPAGSACSLLPTEGGWSAIVRVPATRTDETWAIELLARDGVLVHPGYFFELRGGTFLVVSLLPPAERFARAARALVARVEMPP